MRRRWLISVPVPFLVVLAVALLPGWAAEKWGPFRGQIVDAETGQPIPGAAVLVVWWESVPNPVQMSRRFYDARETVTDATGKFEVPRLSPPFFSFRIMDPQVTYFAPGYEPVAKIVTPPEGQPFVAPTVVQMRRLRTREERVEFQGRLPPPIPFEKMPNLLRLLNEERRQLGFEPFSN